MIRLAVDANHPQPRSITLAVDAMHRGGIVMYPNEVNYGLAGHPRETRTVERLHQIRGIPGAQRLTLLCRDVSHASQWAHIDNTAYRIMRRCGPGPFTYLLPAQRSVPKLLRRARDVVGIRIPASQTALALIDRLGSPVMTTTAAKGEGGESSHDPHEVNQWFGRDVDVWLDVGPLPGGASTILDLCEGEPKLLRAGAGACEGLF